MKIKNKSMVYWSCRRGMLELDIIINNFFKKEFDFLSNKEKIFFVNMLSYDDIYLYKCLIFNYEPKNKKIKKIIKLIKRSSFSFS
ncbi:ygfY [Wigglesworthia glossinidia endosymbiont of Glossina brevipalpis]|uniref:FAD assembly factor SdhE n=1 Tax=Wigglesworthia glossinidia brevipalpis TaxID=36870 RepID=SDHE_WIGBR|nr:RecName: Full=FAD assembly factor SdhE [Wigglesworthia glossinidia endosymbiont of Glossina brevipalpis]BAC24584.1 ygfY [Wigglesworthia glossinidia endosymbiont of Glossina brevipalpis]